MSICEALFDISGVVSRNDARRVIEAHHYLHSFPSGWVYCYRLDGGYAVYSIPANKNLGPYLFGPDIKVRELARLWAPDGHHPTALTRLIAESAKALRRDTGVEALVSFADANHGHHGGVYQAASWIYTGRSSETRVYITNDGRTVSRRAFHSGSTSYVPDTKPVKLPGKHRYVRPLNRRAARALRIQVHPYPKQARAA
jgi:hypothetical protein